MMKGTFYGVGIGPGDPQLLTIKGKDVLERADIIAYPQSRGDHDSTALQIVAPYVAGKETLSFVLPMTKDAEALAAAWRDASLTIMAQLDQGKSVAFITLGDPSLFSTFMYVFRPIRERGYAWEIIPGVTAPTAAAAVLGCGLADSQESLAITAATADLAALEAIIAQHDNIVLMKGASRWEALSSLLEKMDLTDCTAAVEHCTMADQRVFQDIRQMPVDLSYFLTAIIRKGMKT